MNTPSKPITDLERIVSAMAANDGEYASYWDPQPGEMLVGTVESFTIGQTKVGERRICNVTDRDSGQLIAVWLSRSMLQSLFAEHDPKVGDTIVLKYHGLRQPKRSGGSEYHAYSLQVARTIPTSQALAIDEDGPPVDWRDLEARAKEHDDDVPF